jgi:iron complex outermembrane receptor protein
VDVSCHIVTGPDCPTHFKDSASWNSLSPKVGLTYRLDAETLLYAHWTRGFRSGGYNLRDSFFDLTQGLSDVEIAGLEALGLEVARDLGTEGFDEEQIDNFEIGVKKTWGDRARLNASFFYNFVDGLQRELAFGEDLPAPDPVTGRPVITFVDGRPTIQTVQNIVQVVRNTADAEFWGLEMEGMVVLSPGLVFLGSLGYVEPDYTKVRFDLNRDGKLDDKDEDLEPPRAAHWTYSLGLLHNLRVGTRARLASRVTYAYRDKEYTNDDNTGFNRQQKMLQAGVDIHLDNSQWVVGLYGKNLLDYARFGTDIQLPTGTLSPLMRGRVFGLELTYHFIGS